MIRYFSRNWAIKLGYWLCFLTASPVFAQSAPVYDIESIQQGSYMHESRPVQGISDHSPTVAIVQGSAPQENGPQQFVPHQEAAYNTSQPRFVPSGETGSSSRMTNEQRLRRLEQQLTSLQANETTARIESLQTQVQTLNGQVEQLTHALAQLQKQKMSAIESNKPAAQTSQPLKEIEKPVSQLPVAAAEKLSEKAESKPAAALPIEKLDVNPITGKQPDIDEEQQIYQSAYTLIKAKKYQDATDVLQKMLNKYPQGQFASNAHYWLGELFGLQGYNDKALDQFNLIIKNYPKSPRLSDAQLKVGLILASQLKWSDAKRELKKVISKYPGTASAKTAAEQLKQIKQAGH